MKNENSNRHPIAMVLLLLLFFIVLPTEKTKAEDATAVSIGKIDYENLTMQVYSNNNTIINYSTDNKTWIEVDGPYDSTKGIYTMDISWVSARSDVTLYFKGDVVKTIRNITLPMQNMALAVTYDKVEGEIAFENEEESTTFEWRKLTDYNWNKVDMSEKSVSYRQFVDQIENFMVKGARITIRMPQEIGTGISNVGLRPSKEVSVTIPARGIAPSIKVNASKLTTNTTAAMEYYDSTSSLWVECTKSMSLEELAPTTLYANGGKTVTLKIRTAATTSSPYSKTTYFSIPGQAAAPTIGGNTSDVTYYYMNSKLMLQFNNASAKNNYEYTMVKSGSTYDVTTAYWKTVSSSKLMTFSSSSAPSGCTIYVRKKGTDANTSSNTSLVLASAENNFTVSY